jgi:hypothetical protein
VVRKPFREWLYELYSGLWAFESNPDTDTTLRWGHFEEYGTPDVPNRCVGPTTMTREDPRRTARGDRRATTVTDSIAAGSLVVLAVVLAAGLGLGVLYAPSDGGSNATRANFSYQHFSEDSVLVVTFSRGDSIPAGELAVTSGETNRTWATLANMSESKTVSEGSTIQLSRSGPFGKSITTNTQVQILYTGGNETQVVSRWPPDSGGG